MPVWVVWWGWQSSKRPGRKEWIRHIKYEFFSTSHFGAHSLRTSIFYFVLYVSHFVFHQRLDLIELMPLHTHTHIYTLYTHVYISICCCMPIRSLCTIFCIIIWHLPPRTKSSPSFIALIPSCAIQCNFPPLLFYMLFYSSCPFTFCLLSMRPVSFSPFIPSDLYR